MGYNLAMSEERVHPLIEHGLPDWLSNVPMDAPKPTWVPVGEGKVVSLRTLVDALQAEVGVICGSFSITPELQKLFTQFTENSAWGHLPTEPTSVSRTHEDTWVVKVGDFEAPFNGQQIRDLIQTTLNASENNSTS